MKTKDKKTTGMTANKKLAIEFILLFGLVSAFGDVTYEGARSVYGTYLGLVRLP